MDAQSIITIIIAILGSGGLWSTLQFCLDRKVKKRGIILDNIQQEIKEMHNKIDTNSSLSIVSARERLNFLTNHYIELGYIPKDEFDNFIALGEIYVLCGGNAGVDEKYIKTKTELPVR